MYASAGSRLGSYSPLPTVPSSCCMWCSVIVLPRMAALQGLTGLERRCSSRSSLLRLLESPVRCPRWHSRSCCSQALALAFALRLSLLPASAALIGILVLRQIPTLVEIAGILLVAGGVALHREAEAEPKKRVKSM